MEKSIFIRTDEEVWSMAHTIAKAESRSLNQQLIYMIKAKYQEMGLGSMVVQIILKMKDAIRQKLKLLIK